MLRETELFGKIEPMRYDIESEMKLTIPSAIGELFNTPEGRTDREILRVLCDSKNVSPEWLVLYNEIEENNFLQKVLIEPKKYLANDETAWRTVSDILIAGGLNGSYIIANYITSPYAFLYAVVYKYRLKEDFDKLRKSIAKLRGYALVHFHSNKLLCSYLDKICSDLCCKNYSCEFIISYLQTYADVSELCKEFDNFMLMDSEVNLFTEIIAMLKSEITPVEAPPRDSDIAFCTYLLAMLTRLELEMPRLHLYGIDIIRDRVNLLNGLNQYKDYVHSIDTLGLVSLYTNTKEYFPAAEDFYNEYGFPEISKIVLDARVKLANTFE